MSRPDTAAHTRNALRSRGLRVETLLTLTDVDTMSDAEIVAVSAKDGRFAAAVADIIRARLVSGGVR
jgi:glycosyltransferase A (GT-A) superfamily protein (DUF2064 family)